MEQDFTFSARPITTTVIIASSFQPLGEALLSHFPGATFLFCIDQGVPQAQIDELSAVSLSSKVFTYTLQGGESGKTREQKQVLEDWCLMQEIGSDVVVVGIGGGAFLDLVGFFAATYCRGVSLVLIPSTFLSMVDSALGGRNGVNACGYKNLIGSTWNPRLLYINLQLLWSLPAHHVASGLVEVVKHAFLSSKDDVDDVFAAWPSCIQMNEDALQRAILRSLATKAKVVEESLVDPEKFYLLNIGHTIGHAIEGLEKGRVSHGLAVAIGLYIEAKLGYDRGVVEKEVFDATERILQLFPVEKPLSRYTEEEWHRALSVDKKNRRAIPHVVWIESMGTPYRLNGQYRIPLTADEQHRAYLLLNRFCREDATGRT
jgi:3-dehydroquinate synthase